MMLGHRRKIVELGRLSDTQMVLVRPLLTEQSEPCVAYRA